MLRGALKALKIILNVWVDLPGALCALLFFGSFVMAIRGDRLIGQEIGLLARILVSTVLFAGAVYYLLLALRDPRRVRNVLANKDEPGKAKNRVT
jgi:hypothetical protein